MRPVRDRSRGRQPGQHRGVEVVTPQEAPKCTSEDRGWPLGARSSGNSMPPASQGCSWAQIVGSLGTKHQVGQMTSRHRGQIDGKKENNSLGELWSFVLAPTCTSSCPTSRPLFTGRPSLTAHLKQPRPPPTPSPSLCSKRCPVPACRGADIPEASTSAPQEPSVNNAPALFNAGPAPPNSSHRQRSLNLDAHRPAAHALQVCLLVKKCENHPRANTSQKRRPVDRIGWWGGRGGGPRVAITSSPIARAQGQPPQIPQITVTAQIAMAFPAFILICRRPWQVLHMGRCADTPFLMSSVGLSSSDQGSGPSLPSAGPGLTKLGSRPVPLPTG